MCGVGLAFFPADGATPLAVAFCRWWFCCLCAGFVLLLLVALFWRVRCACSVVGVIAAFIVVLLLSGWCGVVGGAC